MVPTSANAATAPGSPGEAIIGEDPYRHFTRVVPAWPVEQERGFLGQRTEKTAGSEQRVKRSDLSALRPRLAVHGRPARYRPTDSTGVKSSADTQMGHPPSRRGLH